MDSQKYFIIILMTATLVTGHNLTQTEIEAFEVPDEIKKDLPYYLSGYNDDGAPIWILEVGKWNMRKHAEKGGKVYEALEIYSDQMLLNYKGSGLKAPRRNLFAIADMDEFNIRQAGSPKTVQFLIYLFTRVEELGREQLLEQGWIVNANSLWEGIWEVISPLLGSKANVFEFYNTDKNLWIPKLLKRLPKDQLPEKYGGFPNHTAVETFG